MPTNHSWLALVRRVMSCGCCCSLRSCLLCREKRWRRVKCCRNGGCRQGRQWAQRAGWGKRYNWQGEFLPGRSLSWTADGNQWLRWRFCCCLCNAKTARFGALKHTMGRLERFVLSCIFLELPWWVLRPRSSSSICFLSIRLTYITVPWNFFLLPPLKSLAGLCMRHSNHIF